MTSGLAIYDTMQFIRPKVSTLCIGQAASMGSLLLCAGEPGMRFTLPNSRIMVHQPSGGFRGQAADIMLHAQEILKLKRRLNEIYVKHTGKDLKAVEEALERDNFMDAQQAKAFASWTTCWRAARRSKAPSRAEDPKTRSGILAAGPGPASVRGSAGSPVSTRR